MENDKRKIYIDLIIGIVAIGLLILVKAYLVTGSSFEHWCNVRGYEILHKMISPFDPDKEPSVVVLDISDLRPDPDGTTPARTLREIVQALVESGAKAIAIDIDFSPRTDPQARTAGLRAEGDDEFFSYLHEQTRKGVPIFVGVYEGVGPEPAAWLGLESNKDLAADMTIFDEDTTQLPRWLSCGPDRKLNSISMALAEVSGQKGMPRSFVKKFLEDPEDSVNVREEPLSLANGDQVLCKRAFTFVNYAKLRFIQSNIVSTFDPTSIRKASNDKGLSRFRNKLVIIGDGQRGKATDGFFVPGYSRPIAGVYLNASAVYTLVDEPVYRLKHWVTLGLDIVLGLALVLALFRIRMQHHHKATSSLALQESLAVGLFVIVTLVIAWLLIKSIAVLWLDVSLVVFALLLHSKVQEALKWVPITIFKKIRPQPFGK